MGQGDIYAHTVALYNVFWKMNPEACCIPIMGKGRNTGGRSWATAKTVGLGLFPFNLLVGTCSVSRSSKGARFEAYPGP